MRKRGFVWFILILGSLLFWLNALHMKEQTIYVSRHLTLANHLLADLDYTYGDGRFATYPMWGYALLVSALKAVTRSDTVWIFQYLLFVLSTIFATRVIALPGSGEWFLRVLAAAIVSGYAMLLSVRWPGAIMGVCILAFAILHIRGRHVLAAGTLLVAYHFRAEALVFFVTYAAWLMYNRDTRRAGLAGRMALLALVILTPWPLAQSLRNHQPLLTATNHGGVLYISLGQLPGNRWGREHDDRAATAHAARHGISDPWGIEGNRILRRQFYDDVRRHPFEYMKKCVYNGTRVLTGGLYVTEFAMLGGATSFDDRVAHQARYDRYRSSPRAFLSDIVALQPSAWVFVPRVVLQLLSMLLVALLFALTARRLYKGRAVITDPFVLIVLTQVLLSAAAQYQPRHLSHVVVLFLFILFPAARTEQHNAWKSDNPMT